MTLEAAVIGCGLIGQRRAAALTELGAHVRLFDPDPERLAATAAATGGTTVDAAKGALTGAQVAIIATPHDRLAARAAEALEHGCHVLVEKPGSHRLEPLVALAEAAETAGRMVHVGYNHRFHPALLRAKEIVAAGDFGSVMNVRARYGHGGRLGYESEWRADREVSGGGELIDQGSHLLDLCRWLVGELALEFSELRTDFWKMDVEDNAYVAARAGGGAFVWLHASWTEWKNLFSMEIALERAKLEVRGLGGSYGPESLTVYEMRPELGPPDITTWEFPPGDNSWALETADFLAAIEGGSSMGATVDDAVEVMRIIEEVYSR